MSKDEIVALVNELIAKALGAGEAKADEEMAAKEKQAVALAAKIGVRGLVSDRRVRAGEAEAIEKKLAELPTITALEIALSAMADGPQIETQPTDQQAREIKKDPAEGLTGEAKLLTLACGLCETEKMEFRDAWIRVGNEHPEDYAEYRRNAFPVREPKKEK